VVRRGVGGKSAIVDWSGPGAWVGVGGSGALSYATLAVQGTAVGGRMAWQSIGIAATAQLGRWSSMARGVSMTWDDGCRESPLVYR